MKANKLLPLLLEEFSAILCNWQKRCVCLPMYKQAGREAGEQESKQIKCRNFFRSFGAEEEEEKESQNTRTASQCAVSSTSSSTV